MFRVRGHAMGISASLSQRQLPQTRHHSTGRAQRLKQFFALVESLITVVLVLVGVVGLSYRTFRDGGWFMQGLGKVADAYISYPIIALVVTVALFFVYRSLRIRLNKGSGSKFFDYVVYAMMIAGIYFIGHYVIRGTL